MKATKGNKVYSIQDTQKRYYQDMGYDILDDNGNVVAQGRGKTVPLEKYNALAEKLEQLEKKAAKKSKENSGKEGV